MKYFLKDINGELICYSVDQNGDRNYISNRHDFNDIVSYFRDSGFQIKTNYVDLKLEGKNVSLVVKDYDTVFHHAECNHLIKVVDDVYEKQGAIDTTKSSKLSHRHNHSNKHAKDKIVKVGIVVLAGTFLIGLSSLLANKSDKVEALPTPDPGYGYMVEDTRPSDDILINYTFDEDEKIDEMLDEETEGFTMVDSDVVQETPQENITSFSTVELDYERLYDTEKAENCKAMYYDLIKEKAADFGLDAKMMLGIGTQERGEHSRTIDEGGGVGLMQLQYNVWAGEQISAYKLNRSTNEFEKVTLTVTDEMMRDLESNVELACMVMQNCLDYTAYNIPMAIQMYNQGYGSIHEALVAYCSDTDQERIDVCHNQSDLGWIPYCANYNGDPDYLRNVLKWCEDTNFVNYDYDNGTLVGCTFKSTLDLKR